MLPLMVYWRRILLVALRRQWRACLCLYGLMALCALPAHASEATLRVAFVYNFLKFIEWPADKAADELTICALLVDEPVRQALAKLDNKTQQQRPVRVLYLNEAAQVEPHLASCELLYMPLSGADMPLPAQLPPGVVLIADEASFDDSRISIILQRTADNRIEFLINSATLKQTGVTVSSQLLKLAKNYQGGNNP